MVVSAFRSVARWLACRIPLDERGQALWEYVMVGVLILVAAIIAIKGVGTSLGNALDTISQALQER